MIVIDGTSHPSFDKLLQSLNADDIGQVLIGRRTDRNSNVKYTLDCQLWLHNGILDVRPHWTAYKEIRAGEIVQTLINPLTKERLLNRTFLNDSDSADRRNWRKASGIPLDLIQAVCTISGYPLDKESTENMIKWFNEDKKSTQAA